MTAQSLGAAYDDLIRRFGGRFTIREAFPSVGTTAVRLCGNNPERVSLTICNMGAVAINVRPNPAVTTSRGLYVSGSGGILTMDLQADALLPTLEWWGISAGAGNEVYILECWRDTLSPVELP